MHFNVVQLRRIGQAIKDDAVENLAIQNRGIPDAACSGRP